MPRHQHPVICLQYRLCAAMPQVGVEIMLVNSPQVGLEMNTLVPFMNFPTNAAPTRSAPVPESAWMHATRPCGRELQREAASRQSGVKHLLTDSHA